MSIKVIIANNNDILFNSLSKFALQNESKIEIVNVPIDKVNSLIYQIKPRDNLIVLDSITSVTFCTNILKNAINRVDKENIIILVIDSKRITNIINHEKNHHWLSWKKQTDFSFLDAVNLVADTLKDTLEIEKNIELKNVYKEKRTAHYDIRPYEDLRSDESGRCANVYDISITSAIPLILNHIHTQTDQVED